MYDLDYENKVLVQRLVEEVFNRKHTRLIEVFYEPDCWGNSPDGRFRSRTEFSTILARYALGFPDSRMNIDCVVADGECVLVHYTFSGTNTGSWAGLPVTNQAVRLSGVMISRIRNHRIVQQDFVWDALDARRQLSLSPLYLLRRAA